LIEKRLKALKEGKEGDDNWPANADKFDKATGE
jgi:hypothetical protein